MGDLTDLELEHAHLFPSLMRRLEEEGARVRSEAVESGLLGMLAAQVQKGDFTLASGVKSRYYLDARRVTLTSRGADLAGVLLGRIANEHRCDVVAGPATAAIPLVTTTILRSTYPRIGLYTRTEAKGHGAKRVVEGPLPSITGPARTPDESSRCLVVDDVATSGRSLLHAAQALKGHVTVVAAAVLVDRSQGAAKVLFESEGIQFVPIFKWSEVLRAAGFSPEE